MTPSIQSPRPINTPNMATTVPNLVPASQFPFQSIEKLHQLGLTEPPLIVPAGDAKRGGAIFKAKCAQCHTADKDGGVKAGPPLYQVFGRKAGTHPEYSVEHGAAFGKSEEEEAKYRNFPPDWKGLESGARTQGGAKAQSWAGRPYHINSYSWDGRFYSDANVASGIIWSDKHLYGYLTDPKGYIPGTKMGFCGLKKDSDRTDVIEWLRTNVGATNPGFGAPYDGPEPAEPVKHPPLGPFIRKKSNNMRFKDGSAGGNEF